MSLRRLRVAGWICVLALALTGVPGRPGYAQGGGAKKYVINFNLARAITFAPLMVADAQHFFADVDVEVHSTNLGVAGMTVIQGVIGGTLDVGGSAAPELILAVGQRAPVVAVAVYADGPGRNALVARTGSNIRSAQDLVGKKLAMEQGGALQFLAQLLVDRNHLDPKSVQMVPVLAPDMPAALQSGTVDAAISYEPYASAMIFNKTGYAVERMDKYLDTQPVEVVFNKGSIEHNREGVKRFLAAWHRGMQWVRQHNVDETAAIVHTYIPNLPQEVLAPSLQYYTWDPRLSERIYQSAASDIAFQKSLGKLTRDVAAKELFDPSVIADVMKEYPQFYSDLK